jgi:hypothetical protein
VDGSAYSAKSSPGIQESGFGADFSAWCSFLRVLLYHHAAAKPPASTETAATAPSRSQLAPAAEASCGADKLFDSKEFCGSSGAMLLAPSIALKKDYWVLDAAGTFKVAILIALGQFRF